MGINGLLPFLKKSSHTSHISEMKGSTVAIDAYCWLHRGAFSCADKLVMGQETDQYVNYVLKYINNLLLNDIKPILVFDGCRLPSKRDVEKKRKEQRDLNRAKALQLLKEGKKGEARDCMQKCVDITSTMALKVMNACRKLNVDCIVAPYEADAQLAYLNRSGIAQLVITEDSDLLLFGCDRVMFKMDIAGNGILIEQKNLNQALNLPADYYTFDKFRMMCILSGCDYLPSLPGIGLGKASKVFRLTRQPDIKIVLKKLPAILKMPSLTVSADYINGFVQAYNTFLYQLVYNPAERKLQPLTPYPPDIKPNELQYAGPFIEPSKAFQISIGNIDISSGKTISDFNIDKYIAQCRTSHKNQNKQHLISIWDKNYQPIPQNKVPSNFVPIKRSNTVDKKVVVKMPSYRPPTQKRERVQDESDSLVTDDVLNQLYQSCDENDSANKKQCVQESMTSVFDITPVSTNLQTPKLDICDNAEKHFSTNSDTSLPHQYNELGLDDHSISEKSEKKLTIKSPKNVFAKKSQTKRFSLDDQKAAGVEIHSRFFQMEKPLCKTNFGASLEAASVKIITDTKHSPSAQGNASEADPTSKSSLSPSVYSFNKNIENENSKTLIKSASFTSSMLTNNFGFNNNKSTCKFSQNKSDSNTSDSEFKSTDYNSDFKSHKKLHESSLVNIDKNTVIHDYSNADTCEPVKRSTICDESGLDNYSQNSFNEQPYSQISTDSRKGLFSLSQDSVISIGSKYNSDDDFAPSQSSVNCDLEPSQSSINHDFEHSQSSPQSLCRNVGDQLLNHASKSDVSPPKTPLSQQTRNPFYKSVHEQKEVLPDLENLESTTFENKQSSTKSSVTNSAKNTSKVCHSAGLSKKKKNTNKENVEDGKQPKLLGFLKQQFQYKQSNEKMKTGKNLSHECIDLVS